MKAALLAVLLVSGCCTVPKTVTVRVPLPVPCLEAPLAGPRYTPDAELVRLPDEDMILAIAADRQELIAWSDEAQAVMKACVKGNG